MPGDLYCFNQGQGACLTDGKCEGGDFKRDTSGVVQISGNRFLDTVNLFATRDHFRAPVADLAQLQRVLRQTTASGNLNSLLIAQGAQGLDATQITYAGQSLGGIVGTMFTSSSPYLKRSLLNVPGGDLAQILLTAPAFSDVRSSFLGTLALGGINIGTPAFDEFIGMAKWILGPSDPQNAAYWMLNRSSAPSTRKVLIQYIVGDAVMPNPTTDLLIAGANRGSAASPEGKWCSVYQFNPSTTALPAANRHGFLLNFTDPATTATAQLQAAQFISAGVTP
jgi:hypothetical protein